MNHPAQTSETATLGLLGLVGCQRQFLGEGFNLTGGS